MVRESNRNRPTLKRLARALGVLDRFVDAAGRLRVTSDDTRMAIVRALGFEAPTEKDAAASLAALRRRAVERVIEPIRVVAVDDASRGAIPIGRSASAEGKSAHSFELRLEDGRVRRGSVRTTLSTGASGRRRFTFMLPVAPPEGYHDLVVSRNSDGVEFRQRLVVAPRRCFAPENALGGRRGLGLWTHLYTLRGEPDRGIGDLGALRQLGVWAARHGADFVGLNPLHALWNRRPWVSPYSPVSRVFRNPIYLDIEAVPEIREASTVSRIQFSTPFRQSNGSRERGGWIDYDAVFMTRTRALRACHRAFRKRHAGRGTSRGRACADFRRRMGSALVDFATFMAIADHVAPLRSLGRASSPRPGGTVGGKRETWDGAPLGGAFDVDPTTWPRGLRSPRSPDVETFRRAHEEEVDFHCYLQFELDRQLGALQHALRGEGMGVGLFHDLAIGTSHHGFDVWRRPDLFVPRMSVGCPPDAHSRDGQNWSFPPMNPVRLWEFGLEPWAELLRANMTHGGMLRIDHVMGLFRQFWIPEGRGAADGAYVRFPADELLGVLALESARHRVVVVGEDLGTVPRAVPRRMKQRGLLSTKVLYFEKTSSGSLKKPSAYPRNAMAMLGTHDLPTLSAFLSGADLEVKSRVSREAARSDMRRALRDRDRDIEHLLDLLDRWGWGLGGGARSPKWEVEATPVEPAHGEDCGCAGCDSAISYEALVHAAYSALCRTRCRLVALSVDDLSGETAPLNIPGTTAYEFPNWTRRMAPTVDALVRDPALGTILRSLSTALRSDSE